MNRTEKVISDAFWQLLEEKPYNKITVQNIVERCQVNRNTFYYHFQDIPALTEYSIREWADEVINHHCESGSPISCITPVVQECTKRRVAFLHLYRSSHREAFMRHLNQIGLHVVRSYVDKITETLDVPREDKESVIKLYKCTLIGVILDWYDADMSYDLLRFCEQICDLFEGSGQRAISRYTKRS